MSVKVKRDGTAVIGGRVVGSVRREWIMAVGYMWVARSTTGQKVGTGARRRDAIEALAERISPKPLDSTCHWA